MTAHIRILLGAALAVAAAACTAAKPDNAGATVVLLVRHGQKASAPGDDPPLSDSGRALAAALADALRDAGVTRVITTQWHRTQEMAAPLEELRGLPSTVIPVDLNHVPGYAQAVADTVRHSAGVTLVVGHQNTIPAVIAALGGPTIPEPCPNDYGDLFILVLAPPPSPASLVRATFGAAHAPHGPTCPVSPGVNH
jgi:broad specificity phosphatase PhoE